MCINVCPVLCQESFSIVLYFTVTGFLAEPGVCPIFSLASQLAVGLSCLSPRCREYRWLRLVLSLCMRVVVGECTCPLRPEESDPSGVGSDSHVMWVLGNKLRSSARTVCALNCWAVFLAPCLAFYVGSEDLIWSSSLGSKCFILWAVSPAWPLCYDVSCYWKPTVSLILVLWW